MRSILQNSQTNKTVEVGMINQFSKNCYMNIDKKIRVLDFKTKKPLIGAHIVNLSQKNVGTTTDNNGYFLYKNLKARGTKQEKIQVSYLGYGTLVITAHSLLSAKILYLKEKIEELPSVTVTNKPQEPNKQVPTNQATNTPTPEQNKKVEVQPSLNDKVKKSKSWIWIAVAVLVAGGVLYFSSQKKPKTL